MDKVQKDAFLASTKQFWADIKSLEKTACDVVQSDQDSLPERFRAIRDELNAQNLDPKEITEHILDYATLLLGIPTRYPPDAFQTDHERDEIQLLNSWMKITAEVVDAERQRVDGAGSAGPAAANAPLSSTIPLAPPTLDVPRDFNELRDEILMESLTAAWLALYFLGLPFAQIWERVRRMADERGGYPSGACVTKFIGDIHRIGRMEMARELKAYDSRLAEAVKQGHYDDSQTLILSYMPFSLLRRLIYQASGHQTPAAAHRLGNCYMLLQMRLYIREGFPIRYLVSRESLEQTWNHLLANPENEAQAQQMFDEIPGWMHTVFPNDVYHQSVQLLMSNEWIAGMSTCVLGRQVGVYVLDTARTSLPFAGNQLVGSLLLSYRAKLNNIDRGTKTNLIQLCGGPPVPDRTSVQHLEYIKHTLHEILIQKRTPIQSPRRA